jgi:hypothetical protein
MYNDLDMYSNLDVSPMYMSSAFCTRLAVSRTQQRSDDRYVFCFGQSIN